MVLTFPLGANGYRSHRPLDEPSRRPLVQPALAADNWGGWTLVGLVRAASSPFSPVSRIRSRQEGTFTMEIRCETLNLVRFATELREIVLAIQEQAEGDLSVMYGWACTDDEKNQWEWIRIPASGLSDFIAASVQKGIYEQGCADLLIEVPSLAVEVTLCHETDIHIKGKANNFLEHFRLRWLRQGIKVCPRTGVDAEWQDASLNVTEPPSR